MCLGLGVCVGPYTFLPCICTYVRQKLSGNGLQSYVKDALAAYLSNAVELGAHLKMECNLFLHPGFLSYYLPFLPTGCHYWHICVSG